MAIIVKKDNNLFSIIEKLILTSLDTVIIITSINLLFISSPFLEDMRL